MKVLVSGSSGLIGTALCDSLAADGHTVARLRRPGGAAQAADVRWDPANGQIDAAAMEGVDAVVNLSGASIGEGRWTEARKKILRSSRVDATRLLVEALARLGQRPRVFISSSASGFYGHRGDELLTESSAPGDDFIARLARDWEAEAARAQALGIRTTFARFGVVLAPQGGALRRMMPPFRLGLGGRLGSGKQWMPWIALEDAIAALRFALVTETLSGPINFVAPGSVANAEFTRVLARVLHRPAIFPAPAFALRLALGEMAEALLLASQHVIPEKLSRSGFTFRYGELEAALRAVLERQR